MLTWNYLSVYMSIYGVSGAGAPQQPSPGSTTPNFTQLETEIEQMESQLQAFYSNPSQENYNTLSNEITNIKSELYTLSTSQGLTQNQWQLLENMSTTVSSVNVQVANMNNLFTEISVCEWSLNNDPLTTTEREIIEAELTTDESNLATAKNQVSNYQNTINSDLNQLISS